MSEANPPCTTPQLYLYAYLAGRDDESRHAAEITFSKLRKFKQDAPNSDSVKIFAAYDDGLRAVGMFEIEHDTPHPNTVPGSGPVGTFLSNFLQFLQEARAAEVACQADRPRMLIFSSHGVAGYGVAYDALMLLRDPANRETLAELLREFPRLPYGFVSGLENKWTDDEQRLLDRGLQYVSGERVTQLVRQLKLLPKAKIDADDKLALLRLLAQLKNIRSQGNSVESGITHVAVSGDGGQAEPELDKLSIKQIRDSIQAAFPCSGNRLPFDLALFHACSLGIPETVWELRPVARVSLLCPIVLSGVCEYAQWLPPVADLDISSESAREQFPLAAAELILDREKYVRVNSAALLGSLAFSPSDAAGQGLWTAFRDAFQQWAATLGQPAHKTRIQQAWQASRNFCPPGSSAQACTPCHRDLLDLKHFADQLNSEPALQSDLGNQQAGLLHLKSFAKSNAAAKCHCRTQGGLTLYFPEHKDYLALLPEYNHHTFDWLQETGWHLFLTDFLA